MHWIFRLFLSPLLFPLSVVYGMMALFYRASSKPYKAKSRVISVGNIAVGGSGKTPLVIELVQILQKKGFNPVVISKSYKSQLNKPLQILEGAAPLKVGDEAVLLKNTLKNQAFVFSGPHKNETLKFAEKELSSLQNKIFILDDGAQHHKIFKDFKIHVWDLQRPFLDIFPFPLGMSREFWFLSENPDAVIFNRKASSIKLSAFKFLVSSNPLVANYKVQSIKNIESGKEISDKFVLISGIGNFSQLYQGVVGYKSKDQVLTSIRGQDHDHFKWFRPQPHTNYVCTEKDLVKLKDIVKSEFLFVIKSSFSKEFLSKFKDRIESFLEVSE